MNKNINERLKITVIGCGQAGGSITARIEESVNDLGGNKANTSFVGINTSTEDLASVKLSHKIHMNNSKGAACNRENGVQDLAESIDTILDELHSYIIEDSIVFIATSLGGGTGSAIAPQLAEILLDEGYKVGMIVVLPADNESLKIRDNARQTFYEIEELKPRMGSIYILDNNATEKMKINSTFASLFASILCINNKSQDGNMDLAEIEACILTPSFSIITRANKNNGTTANIIDVLNRDSNIFAKREDKTITTMGISEAVSAKESKQISAAYYKSLISSEKGEKNKLIKERKDLQKSLNDAVIKGSIKKGSDEWHEMVSAINEVTNAIDESTQSIVEYQNALRQLKWDTFDKSLETVKRVNSEADYYIDLLSHKDMTDKDTGNFTEYGIATIGLHKTNYDNYIAQAEAYQSEYDKIMKQIEKGELSASDENVIQRLRDLQDAHREAKKSAEDELESINDLVKQGYEAQTDALSKLIEKYKKLKDSELDAYKYQKEIAEKTKQIASLQKQLIPYSNNDTEESRAQIQKLKVELENAKSDLKDTQYEKFISDTEDMLDDLMNDYQEFIDEKLNDTNTILDSIKELLGGNDGIIATLKSLDSSLTNTTKDQIDSSTTNGGDGGQGAKDYVHNTVTNDQNKVNSKTDTSNYDPAKEADIAKKKNGIAQKKKAINGQRQSFQNQIKELESQLKQLYGELNSIENKYQFEKSSTKNKDKLQDLKNNYIEKKSGLNAMIQDVTHNKDMLQQFIADLDKQSAQLDKDLVSLKGYEKGSKHIDKSQLAWTQEDKREMIYRASDGAVLTKLNPGDKVFTNEMTENLWKMAQMNPSLLTSGINYMPNLPEITKSAGTSTIVEVGDIVMNGVNDPETFGRQLREEILKNGKTTQCITEAVSAKQLGKNGVGNARLYK